MVTYLLGKKLMKNSLILTRPFLINRFQVKILMNFYYNTLFPCQWLVRNGDKIGGCHFLDEKDFFFIFLVAWLVVASLERIVNQKEK